MNLINKIENVSFIDNDDRQVFIGVDTEKESTSPSTRKIICLEAGDIVKELDLEFFYFMAFNQGVVYNINEGGSLYFTDFNDTKEILPEGNYINPLGVRDSKNYFLYTEMDKQFNKDYFLFEKLGDKRKLPTFMFFAMKDGFVSRNRQDHSISYYDKVNLDNIWNLTLDAEQHKMDKKQKPFGGVKSIFIPMADGKLMSINSQNGSINWVWGDNETTSGVFNDGDGFIFQNFGKGFVQIDKSTGHTTQTVMFEDIKGLSSFLASGPIWCFEKCLMLVDLFSGKLITLNKQSFELEGCHETSAHMLPTKRHMIKYINGFLYVLCNDKSLKILQLTPKSKSKFKLKSLFKRNR